MLTLAINVLKKGGRIFCLEPVKLLSQDMFSKWVVDNDRGQNVRKEQEWKLLFEIIFPKFETFILNGLSRIPSMHILIQGTNE